MLIGFIYGNLTAILLPGAVFTPTLYLGINWVNLIYVNIVWWGIIQGVLTFYIATRLAPRDWSHTRLSRRGWVFSLLVIVGIYLVLRIFARNVPKISYIAIGILLVLSIVLMYIIRRTLKKDFLPMYQPSRFMDIIAISTIIVFIVSFIFLTSESVWMSIHYINLPALKLVTVWNLGWELLL